MIQKNFTIDPEKKEIRLKSKKSAETYTVQELYSYLMDIFDEPEFMRYDLPIEATGKDEFKLINGWSIDEEAKKHLIGELV